MINNRVNFCGCKKFKKIIHYYKKMGLTVGIKAFWYSNRITYMKYICKN